MKGIIIGKMIFAVIKQTYAEILLLILMINNILVV